MTDIKRERFDTSNPHLVKVNKFKFHSYDRTLHMYFHAKYCSKYKADGVSSPCNTKRAVYTTLMRIYITTYPFSIPLANPATQIYLECQVGVQVGVREREVIIWGNIKCVSECVTKMRGLVRESVPPRISSLCQY